MEIPYHKQVKYVAYKLKVGAATSWDQIQFQQRRQGKRTIKSWRKMKEQLKDKVLPFDWEQVLYRKFQD